MESISHLLAELGVDLAAVHGDALACRTPINGAVHAMLRVDTPADVTEKIDAAHTAFTHWRNVPAPRRGELIRLFGDELRTHKQALGKVVTAEAGKILQEGLGEVQEMIDICDFAVGLSRQLYGLTIASERPGHRMMEAWHPVGVVGVISAFNFPVAVWAWNAALALVCGNSVVWKPSEKTPLTALATHSLFLRAVARFGADAPDGLAQLVIGDHRCGAVLVDDRRVPVVSATGSTRMGRAVAERCAQRLARTILELGGNNAMIVAPSADLDMALRGIVFSAVGTAGQRCTTLRRLFVHDSVYDTLLPRLKKSYASLPIGNPADPATLVGPLIDQQAFDAMQASLTAARDQQGVVHGGERVAVADCAEGYYVRPALVEMPLQSAIMHHETFAPILYVVRYQTLAEAIALNNAVPQGLSSSIFTTDLREAETFVSVVGSDCGIANVNIGPSGAEIGGAFGGEKETGGGRESGSDAWKGYMRRATNTVNYSSSLPLAQGISFEL
ncbi:aldehyde dehydrogenase (NAD+) [Actimicrobium sp. GrIS 1.19]|uniref:L-piperidine-6-carboxylate dehydrogenase n=1 Tax=Actimicrobium sp. GrIS 1.19 TaxID=3071708 RepID=UPI002DF7E8A4|nr:aldehyde dehydrogenase (NAD+) [Actimicrobium sp. GrIS 1.19]